MKGLLPDCCLAALLHTHGYTHIAAHGIRRDVVAELRVGSFLLLTLPDGVGHVAGAVEVDVVGVQLALVQLHFEPFVH